MIKSALVIIDVQRDFCQDGALAVPGGDEIVPVLNKYIELFSEAGLPIYATRDWHPAQSHHFKDFGGLWPPHCVQGTEGAEFHPDLQLPEDVEVVSAGVGLTEEGYSSFEGHNEKGEALEVSLRNQGVTHLYTAGLATDYCVSQTSLDALSRGFQVTVLEDAIRGIDVQQGDSQNALYELSSSGSRIAAYGEVADEVRQKRAA